MNKLRTIDDAFVDEYIFNHRKNLGKPLTGGTDWRFADIIAPAFREILEIAKPESILEIGFNAGASALMFLSINPELDYHSVDIEENKKSVHFLKSLFNGFRFFQVNSSVLIPHIFGYDHYDLVFVDGNHEYDAVVSDIEVSLKFNPEYILFDDVLHPSHIYIHDIINICYSDKLEIVKLYVFNNLWQGYSMALCKVKK